MENASQKDARGLIVWRLLFKPLINLLREQQLDGDYLQADETRLQVLKETGKAAQSDK
ncbi:IS66 family transposase, partial [Thiolapillus sp.]